MIKSLAVFHRKAAEREEERKHCDWKNDKNLFARRYLKIVQEIEPTNGSQMHNVGIQIGIDLNRRKMSIFIDCLLGTVEKLHFNIWKPKKTGWLTHQFRRTHTHTHVRAERAQI